MPQLVAKVEGRGNGIRTNVVNNGEIAKALSRPPEYVLKYFGCELGAQTRFEKDMGTSIVNGAHTQKVLSDLLEGFIKKFVQCYTCGNPETVMKVRKDFVTLKCKACGAKSEVDPRLKLNTFILKNPPEVRSRICGVVVLGASGAWWPAAATMVSVTCGRPTVALRQSAWGLRRGWSALASPAVRASLE